MFDTTDLHAAQAALEILIRKAYVRHDPGDPPQPALYSPRFWEGVFVEWFGTPPDSHTDPRWDTLLHTLRGLRFLRNIS